MEHSGRPPGGPSKGFTGSATSSVNSVVSNISETNTVIQNVPRTVVTRSQASGTSANTLLHANIAPHVTTTIAVPNTTTVVATTVANVAKAPASYHLTSISAQISKASTQLNAQCLFCDLSIIDRSKSIKCSVCSKLMHFKCAESGSMDENVLKLIKAKQPMHYICVRCTTSLSKGRLLIQEKDGQIVSNELKEMSARLKSNEEYTLRQSKEIDRLLEKNVHLTTRLTKIAETETSSTIPVEWDSIIQSLQAQIEALNNQIQSQASTIEALTSKSKVLTAQNTETTSSHMETNENASLEMKLKDEEIATLNQQIVSLNTQITLLLDKPATLNGATYDLPEGKRRRDNSPNSEAVIEDAEEMVIDNEAEFENALIENETNKEAELLNELSEDAPLDLKTMKVLMSHFLTPLRRELGNLHDRIDQVQYPEQGNTKQVQLKQLPPRNQQRTPRNHQNERALAYPSIEQSQRNRSTKVSYKNI